MSLSRRHDGGQCRYSPHAHEMHPIMSSACQIKNDGYICGDVRSQVAALLIFAQVPSHVAEPRRATMQARRMKERKKKANRNVQANENQTKLPQTVQESLDDTCVTRKHNTGANTHKAAQTTGLLHSCRCTSTQAGRFIKLGQQRQLRSALWLRLVELPHAPCSQNDTRTPRPTSPHGVP